MSNFGARPFLKSRLSNILAGLTGLALAYILASLAIDTGSLWQYLATLIVLVLSLRALIKGLNKK